MSGYPSDGEEEGLDMMQIATAGQMREIDRTAIEDRGIPSTVLMENAARALTEACLSRLGSKAGGQTGGIFPGCGLCRLGCDLMVDALFGIGLNSPLRGDPYAAVAMMNTCSVPVISADIASGVEADTGRVLGIAVEADQTVTFTRPKTGHFLGQGGVGCGALTVADIGTPPDLLRGLDDTLRVVRPSELRLPRPAWESYKGN